MTSLIGKVIIAGNWKMHKTRKEGCQLAEEIKAAIKNQQDLPEIILIPPFTSLQAVGECIEGSPVSLGAQNMDYRDNGAYTGEISPLMLVDLKVKYVLIGHSERRQYFGETNATVNLRLKAALAHGLKPILCVGESIDERESGLTDAVVSRQVAAALAEVDQAQLLNLIIAYEPVWAIGTGKNCEASEANRLAALIRSTLARLYGESASGAPGKTKASMVVDPDGIPILYGGSIKPANVEEQLKQVHIDGGLVGGASLQAAEFIQLIKTGCKRVNRNRTSAAAAI